MPGIFKHTHKSQYTFFLNKKIYCIVHNTHPTMSDKFLGTGYSNVNLTNGRQQIYASTLGAANLQPSMATKTNTMGQLMSSNLDINDVNNLQSALDNAGGVSAKVVNITDAIENASTSFKGNIIPSQNIIYDLGEGGDAFRDIYTNRLLSPNGLTSITIADDSKTTFTGTVQADVLKKTGGTSSQYLMADGSSLQYSANSGNSNFYLYKSHTNTPTPPPTAGLVYYNNAVQKDATIIYISHKTDDNIDVEVFFNNLSTLNDVYIQQKTLSENFIKYNITATPTIVSGSHIAIPVAYISFGGTGETYFGNLEPILVSFFTNTIETDLRLTTLETKTQNQVGIAGETNYTGLLKINGNVEMNGYAVTIQPTGPCSLLPSGTLLLKSFTCAGNIAMGTNKITGLGPPFYSSDGANKSYVDSSKLYTDLTPTSTPPLLVEGRMYYDDVIKNLVYAKNDNWFQITSILYTPTPFLQANLKGWFDASNANSISQTPGNVAVWNDLSSSGFNLTGITATPRTGDTTVNGKNVVNFDGTECIYRTGSVVNYYRHTIIIVSTATVAQRDIYGSSGVVAGDVLFNVNTSGTYRAHAFRTGDGLRDSTFTLNTGMSIRIQRVGATTMDIIENGNTKKNSFIFGGTDPAILKGIYLGYRSQSVLTGFIGSMGEVLVFDTNVSDSQLNIIGNYLGNKWGVTWTNI